MASGLPDYTKQTRLWYGSAQLSTRDMTVVANVETDVLVIFGKGEIYGGRIWIYDVDTCEDDEPWFYVDGVVIQGFSLNHIEEARIDVEHAACFYALRYDNVNFKYSLGISEGITFDEKFGVTFKEEHGRTPHVLCSVNYALVQ